MSIPPKVVTVAEVQVLCQRVRSAGSPNAKARPPLVAEYGKLSVALGVAPEPVVTGLDLQRAAAGLLRTAALAEAAAAQTPAARMRRAGRPSAELRRGRAGRWRPRGPVVTCGLARPRTGVVDLWQQGSASQ